VKKLSFPLLFLILALAGAGAWFLFNKNQDPFAGLQHLPVRDFQLKPGNFNGNTYLIQARMVDQTNSLEGVGRLWKAQITDSSGKGGGEHVVILVPDELRANVQPDQRYRIKVDISESLCHVVQMEKF
jgi:hypothetical protein